MLEDRRRRNDVPRVAHQLRALGQGVQEPLWDRLGELSVPVLLLVGGYDRAYSDVAQRMAAAIGPLAAVEVVPQAGHAAHLEQPDEVAHRIAAWVSGLETA
jgi:pimeloyl-ACP methyl ester carboxylesterase